MYHSKYFEARAWKLLAIHRFSQAKEQGKYMGIAIGTALHCEVLFKQAGALIPKIPQSYHANFNAKLS
jgi:hypothetical protein